MTERKDLFVGGYCFGSEADAKQAQTEQKQVEFFRTRLEGKSARDVLAVYDRFLDERIFVTPVGWEYLRNVQKQLLDLGVPQENIRQIPLYMTFAHRDEEEKTPVRQIIVPSQKDSEKKGYRISVLANFILVILVAALFLIAVSSDNPNILNYRNEIVNEYASWEQELTQRENALRQKEADLGIDSVAAGEMEQSSE